MSYRYDLLETSIKNRLSSLSPLADINEMPDTAIQEGDPFVKPRITVMYHESEFDESVIRGLPNNYSTDVASQMEYAEVYIYIQGRHLRTPDGVHPLKEEITKLLFGYRDGTGWERLFLKSYKFVKHEKNIWHYVLSMISARPVIQCFADQVLPNTNNVENMAIRDPAGNSPTLREIVLNPNLSNNE